MAVGLPALLGGFGGILVLKEVADFIQIGLVAWQTGKRFSGSRAVRGGSVGIDGSVVTIMIDGTRIVLPIDDAAGAAGVGGAGGRGPKPDVHALRPFSPYNHSPSGWPAGLAGSEAKNVVAPGRPLAGQDRMIGTVRPDQDDRPFTLREFVQVQDMGKERRQQLAIGAEQALFVLQAAHGDRIKAIDAQLARERIAAEKDITRLQIVARLEVQRRDLLAAFARQEAELASRLQLQRERLAAEAALQDRRFQLQEGLNEADRRWKTSEAQADRAWRERVEREQSEIAQYRLNLNKDLALTRAVDAAKRIAEIVLRAGRAAPSIVSFASVFGR